MMRMYSVGLGVTSRCNMNCSFCYSKDKRDNSDIAISEWKTFFNNNNELIKDINYGTGENTLLEEWFDLVDYIKKEYPTIKQALTTNGTLISKINSDPLKEEIINRAISEIDVSIDYGDEKSHDLFRGSKNAFQNAIETLEFCHENNIQPTVVIMGIDDNLQPENIEKIFDVARKYQAFVRVNFFRPVNSQCDLLPPKFQTIVDLLDYISDNESIVSLSDPLFNAIFTNSKKHEDPSSWSSIRILPNGFIFPSTYLIGDNFKLCHISDPDALRNLPKNEIIKTIIEKKLPNECRNCHEANRCNGGAVDRRYLWYDSLNERDPYCPNRQNKPVRLRSYKINNGGFSSVHDGYLPTLFFRPRDRNNDS